MALDVAVPRNERTPIGKGIHEHQHADDRESLGQQTQEVTILFRRRLLSSASYLNILVPGPSPPGL
jgi:hypothetical protein